MSLYYNSDNKHSSPKKAWKRLLSTLQLPKVLNRRLARSNTLPRRQNVYNICHHHHHHQHHHHQQQQQQQQQQMITRKSVDHQDIEKRVERKVFAPNDDQTYSNYKASNLVITRGENVEEDDEVVVGCTSMESAFVAPRLHGVDARAEEFIQTNKEAWRLERQKSVEEFFAMLARGS